MTDVARHELKVLMQDTKATINDLKRQRESVTHAIEVAQRMSESGNDHSSETDLLIMELIDCVDHIDSMLNQVVREIEQLEARQSSTGNGHLVSWTIRPDLLPGEDCYGKHKSSTNHRRRKALSLWRLPGMVPVVSSQLR